MRINMRKSKGSKKHHHKAVDRLPSTLEEDTPSVVESDVSSVTSFSDIPTTIKTTFMPPNNKKRKPLQWEFKGLTLWLEFEEFDGDLTKAIEFLAAQYGTEIIPCVHATAIYGMEHLTVEQAKERLAQIPQVLPDGDWPRMEKPVAIKQDISQEGLPGQVCSIAWAELTLKTNEKHEGAMDAISKLFEVERDGSQWTPHISLAYDNPEDSVLELTDIIMCAAMMPSLMKKSRRVKAVSLWSTEGKLGDWQLLDRVHLHSDCD